MWLTLAWCCVADARSRAWLGLSLPARSPRQLFADRGAGWIYVTDRGTRWPEPRLALWMATCSRSSCCALGTPIRRTPSSNPRCGEAIEAFGSRVARHRARNLVWQDLVRRSLLARVAEGAQLWKLDEGGVGVERVCSARYDVAIFGTGTTRGASDMRIVPSPPVMAEHNSKLRTLARSWVADAPSSPTAS